MIEKLFSYFEDPCVDEILINGTRGLIVQGTHVIRAASPYSSNEEFADDIQNFVWQQYIRIDMRQPFAGGIYQDKWRWHAVIAPLATEGPLFSVRRHRFSEISLNQFAGFDRFESEIQKVWLRGSHIFICGPTGAGKSTFLHALLKKNCYDERVIFVEQIPELSLASPFWVRLQAQSEDVELLGKVSLETAVREGLRLRPDRFVVGEIREQEMLAFLWASSSGHANVMTTMHAADFAQFRQKLSLMFNSSMNKQQDMDLAAIFMRRGHPPEIIDVISMG